ncbi:MAG TPA: class I SAM-dependent methyltransferase, partial [Pseudolabrys sp.]|nr:class I SAM-dependent methyltransferase [Pseudolabrys sp.]
MEPAEIQKRRAIETHTLQADEFAASYVEGETDAYRSCFNYSRLRLDEWLERYLPRRGDGFRLLDVGCGTGHHIARLRERGFEVAGVDGSEEMLNHARVNNPGAEIRHADVESLPFADASFDYVICIEVFRYLPSLDRCTEEIARVLKPGGLCLATAAPALSLNGYWVVNRIANLVQIGDLVR